MSSAQAPSASPLQNVRWIVFDAVGTLIFPEPSVAEAYHRIGTRFGSQLSRDDVNQRFKWIFRETEKRDLTDSTGATTSEMRERDRWREIVDHALPDVGDPEGCFEELYNHFADPASWRCFDDVTETLPILTSQGYQCALASNFDERLHRVCAGFDALRDIRHKVISASIGYRKPSLEFYAALFNEIGSYGESVLMVGDDFENDIVGARAAGAQALFLQRKGTSEIPGTLHSLTELTTRLPGVP